MQPPLPADVSDQQVCSMVELALVALEKQIRTAGRRVRGGVWQFLLAVLTCAFASPAAPAELGWRLRDSANAAGAEVLEVAPGGIAAQAGVKAGDVVRQVEKTPVTNTEQFAQRVRNLPEGTPFSIRISREGWEREVLLQPAAAEPARVRKFGLRLADPTPGASPGHGAEIVVVVPASSAARAGLKPGDLVTQVDGRQLAGAGNLVSLMQEAAAQDRALRFTVAREGWEKEVVVGASALPAEMNPAEWQAVDQLTQGQAAVRTQTASSAGPGTTANTQPAEPALSPQTRAELLSLDNAGYQAYKEDLDLADARYQTGNWPEAERYYQRAIQRVPGEPRSWGRLCHILIMRERFSEAVSACRKSLESGAPQPETLTNLGFSYARLGAMTEARDAYLKAIELAPQWPHAYAGLGVVYFTQRDWPQAEKYYRLALDRDPNNVAARQTLEAILRQQAPPVEVAQAAPSSAAAGQAQDPGTPSVRPAEEKQAMHGEAVPVGKKAMIAIGDFQVKAAGAEQFIGDGLREMLLTTMYNDGHYILVERMDLKGLAAEQALSRSRMARPESAIPESQMDVAEIMVYAAVTEFEAEAGGSGLQLGVPKVPLNLGYQSKTAHLAIDVRVVDVATGRLLAAQRITGTASSSQASVGANLSRRGTSIPVSLGTFRNTPMEQAIRECVQKAATYITSSTPKKYFHYD
jgi:curli biogenesis system outer membrane secretion channel CsgG